MESDGKVKFDQGIVVDNSDPDRLGRVKVRLLSDGIDSPSAMHRGDSELQWYEPCIPGAGYEVGSLAIPPVGSFVWCIECEFNTENKYRVYLGSAYGSGPVNSKEFNAMLTPPGVIETPSEALIGYPYTQLLYKSTQGSYLKFYGDSLAGFEMSSGIPIPDAEGSTDSPEGATFNYVYADRTEVELGVSEMPDAIDRKEPEEPEDEPISKVYLDSDLVFSGIVRDRGGDSYNSQEITPAGIYMTVRGNGGVTSPSENKELEDKVTETAESAESTAQKAGEQAMQEVTEEGGAQETQDKVLEEQTKQTASEATKSACKIPPAQSGMTKKEASVFQQRLKELSEKIPGGYGFIQDALGSAMQGNIKALTHHILSAVASTVFSLASALVKDAFNKILSDPDIIDTEEASKFVDMIIGEANLGKLIGKAQEMIAVIGGKLGPFGQLFERAANTVLGVATSKLGIINQISNQLAGIARIKQVFDQIKPTIDSLADEGMDAIAESAGKACIQAINGAMAGRASSMPEVAALASSLFEQAAESLFGNDSQGKENGDKDKADGQPETETPDAGDTASPSSPNPSETDSSENTQPPADAGESPDSPNSPADADNPDSQSGTDSQPPANALTPDEEKTVMELAKVASNAMRDKVKKSAEATVKTLISKTLSNASEADHMETESTEEYENLLYLDAEGARVIVPGEEISNCANLDNNGAEVHVGENCLLQMTASNIMNFVSDPDFVNQTSRIMASDGINDTVDSDSFSNTAVSSANRYARNIDNGVSNSERLYAGTGLGYDPEGKALMSLTQLATANGEQVKSQAAFTQSIASNNPTSSMTVSADMGALSSSLQMEKDKIVLSAGQSSITLNFDGRIDIKGTHINIGGLAVSLGAAVNLGFVPDLGITDPSPCAIKTGQVDWEIEGKMNIH